MVVIPTRIPRNLSAVCFFAQTVKDEGLRAFKEKHLGGLWDGLSSSDPEQMVSAMMTVGTLASLHTPWLEPFTLSFLPEIIKHHAHKNLGVQKAAEEASLAIVRSVSHPAVSLVVPTIIDGIHSYEWRCKVASLKLLQFLAVDHPVKVCNHIPIIISTLIGIVHSPKKEVKETARDTFTKMAQLIENPDIIPIIPDLLVAHMDPVYGNTLAVDKLFSTPFIQPIDMIALGFIVPVLTRGVQNRSMVTKRRCVVIMDSICKLVSDPHDILVFYTQLRDVLVRGSNEIDKEDVRIVCAKTLETLQLVHQDATRASMKRLTETDIRDAIHDALAEHASFAEKDILLYSELTDYIAKMAVVLLETEDEDIEDWQHVFEPYFFGVLPNETTKMVAKEVSTFANSRLQFDNTVDDYDLEEDLCNAEFSLAYGSKVLLHQTSLHLKRCRKYGLIGPNGSGKSTLMRAISNGNLHGFPTDIRCVYVEHDIQGSGTSDVSVLGYIVDDERVLVDEDQVESQLHMMGFGRDTLGKPVSSLSGGWRMKLALARAILTCPDVLLLDEPTNHLDKDARQWLIDYLKQLKITCLIVSHDTGFLDAICSDIIHYEKNRKLKRYHGNLSDFVKQRPEARSYYELSSDVRFHFPVPGPLIGVKSATKAVLKLLNVTFQYPGTANHQLKDISVQVSLASRIAILGANGAGKSTLIKILVGELVLQEGSLIRHPNLRIAYIAQHAFHHIEDHLDKSPCQYIMWRYAGGLDKELTGRNSLQMTEEEWLYIRETAKENKIRLIERLVGRIKSDEYEVQWENETETSYLTRKELIRLGYTKWVQELDERLATKEFQKLTVSEISKHYEELGLDPELSIHGSIGGLSGGQKVKVVLGAALWNRPHIIIMDEPTNFLDRDSLGALAHAVQEFQGGVLLISHNEEFYTPLCSERWILEAGSLRAEGAPVENKGWNAKTVPGEEEDRTDAFGNKVDISSSKRPDQLTRTERKRLEKKRKEMLKAGLDTYDIDEELGIA